MTSLKLEYIVYADENDGDVISTQNLSVQHLVCM